jgi:hypothetical protein
LRNRSARDAEDLSTAAPKGYPGFERGDALRAKAFHQWQGQIGW